VCAGEIDVKTIFQNKFAGSIALMMLGILAVAIPVAAQAPAAAMASVHGTVTNPAGFPVKTGFVKFSKAVAGTPAGDPKDLTYQFSFPLDANGNYKSTDLPGGSYIAVVWSEEKAADFMKVDVKAGEDKTVNFDMTREEFMKGMSEADKKALEEYKKKNATVVADNAKIQNINTVLAQALADQKAGKPDDAVASLQGVMSLRPNEPILWQALGQAQLASADAAYKANKTDPAVPQKYTDAAASYQKAIDLSATAAKKPTPDVLGVYYQNLGAALTKSGKIKEGQDAYDMSAKTNPAAAANMYYNDAANLYNLGKMEDAAAAAEKAIAADPKKPEPYYIKAQGLVQKATVDDKTKKVVLPPGCLEAYQEYLELAPDGPHAQEIKDILNSLGQPIKNSFKAPPTKKP
jgi:tetratricopeptide (TPR) repeat protein